jgi:hypothetical protein
LSIEVWLILEEIFMAFEDFGEGKKKACNEFHEFHELFGGQAEFVWVSLD